MKLVNDEGRFQFIKNGMVELDKSLPKYQKLQIIVDNKEEFVGDLVTSNPDSLDLNNQSIISTGPGFKEVDESLRDIITRMKENNLKQYISSLDASKVNSLFGKYLKGEIKINRESLAIFSNNWQYGIDEITPTIKKDNLISTIKDYFKRKKNKRKEKTEDEVDAEVLSVINLFEILHVEVGKEKEFVDRLSGYFKMIDSAEKMGQTAQLDDLCQHILINIYESVLAANGFNRYIAFEDITKLKEAGKRVVDINYVKDFGRAIPEDVAEKKIKADEMCVFDNYCILYYSPDGEKYTTKKTTTAKRDPILFGLINHSEKLYYIADWSDEYCDLTLDQVADLVKDL